MLSQEEVYGGGYGMFDWEVLELGVKVDMEDGEYEDSEGYSLVVKNGEIVEGGGYGIELK